MPIDARCQSCGGKFQAPDKWAGQRVKCPRCSAVIQLGHTRPQQPARQVASRPQPTPVPPKQIPGDQADWYVQTTDGEQYGPLSKTQLDSLVATGRLDAFCRIRRESWKQWEWAEEVYPDLASSTEPEPQDESTFAGAGTDSPLQPCPDCGKMISRRASQCPNCGCPVAGLADQGVAAGAASQLGTDAVAGRPGQRIPPASSVAESLQQAKATKRKQIRLFVAGVASAVLVIAVVAFLVGWQVFSASKSILRRYKNEAGPLLRELTTQNQSLPEQTPEGSQAEGQAATPEARELCIKEASAAMARQVDDLYRKTHLAMSVLDRTQESIELITSLAEISSAPTPGAKPKPKAAPEPEKGSYQSKYDVLYEECLTYVRDNLPRDEFDRSKIWDVARRWADSKQASLEKQLEEQLGKQLGLQFELGDSPSRESPPVEP